MIGVGIKTGGTETNEMASCPKVDDRSKSVSSVLGIQCCELDLIAPLVL